MRAHQRAAAACAFFAACATALLLVALTFDGSPGTEADAKIARAAFGVTPIETPTPVPPAAALPMAPSADESLAAVVGQSEPQAEAPAPAPVVSDPSTPPDTRTVAPAEARAAQTPVPPTEVPQQPEPRPGSVLSDKQMVVYYGSPLSAGLGVLGTFSSKDAGAQVKERAAVYDSMNGDDLGAVGALDVIYSLAQGEPTDNGLYLRYLPDEYVDEYLRVADEQDLQVVLDLQIGRASPIDEVRGVERFLKNPRVHIALDPEYAVGPDGVPLETPGIISGGEINEVQEYMQSLVQENNLPPKLLVVHQYMDDTIVGEDEVHPVDDVDYVLNMDGFGDVKEKEKKYKHFSSKAPHSKLDSFNVFLQHDDAVMSEQDVLKLKPVPRVIFYQ